MNASVLPSTRTFSLRSLLLEQLRTLRRQQVQCFQLGLPLALSAAAHEPLIDELTFAIRRARRQIARCDYVAILLREDLATPAEPAPNLVRHAALCLEQAGHPDAGVRRFASELLHHSLQLTIGAQRFCVRLGEDHAAAFLHESVLELRGQIALLAAKPTPRPEQHLQPSQ